MLGNNGVASIAGQRQLSLMPELAEVEYYRKQWDPGVGETVERVRLHPQARVFRECDTAGLELALTGAVLERSLAHGKQMLFGFGGGGWLGIHLGMTGKLFTQPTPYAPDRHDHLVLEQEGRVLVFHDTRLFGRVRFDLGAEPPAWWRDQAPDLLSEAFTPEAMRGFLKRRARSPFHGIVPCTDAADGKMMMSPAAIETCCRCPDASSASMSTLRPVGASTYMYEAFGVFSATFRTREWNM